MRIPNDPFMLLSLVNTKLRDEYPSLDDLCRDEDIEKEEVERLLYDAGYSYMENVNQFK